MTLLIAAADLQGVANAVAGGDMLFSLPLGVYGESSASAEITGEFLAQTALQGQAVAGAGLTKVFQLTGTSLSGGSAMGGALASLGAADMLGEATVVAPAELALGAAASVDGQAEVGAAVGVVLEGVTAVQGDGVVGALANVVFAISALGVGESSATARALEDDEISGDLTGEATTAALAILNQAVEAVTAGNSSLSSRAIVRPAVIAPPLPIPSSTGVRMTGFQPGRESPKVEEKFRIVLDDRNALERNRAAPRVRTTVQKDTGTSTTGSGQ